MEIIEKSIVGELVAQDYRTASVFKSFGIDFCCAGNKTIAEACNKKNIEPKGVIEKLQQATLQKNNQSIDFNSWDLDLLADYIVKTHHRYVQQKSLEIRPFLDKVTRVHGDRHPELIEINELFTSVIDELSKHMQKEEMVLFPFIKSMVKAEQENQKIEAPMFGTVQNPIQMMMEEHTNEGEKYRNIATLSNGYTPPNDACNTYRVTFALLDEFEQDLHLHIHLENNILFPKAVELEAKLLS